MPINMRPTICFRFLGKSSCSWPQRRQLGQAEAPDGLQNMQCAGDTACMVLAARVDGGLTASRLGSSVSSGTKEGEVVSMHISFPYANIDGLEIPDDLLGGVYGPQGSDLSTGPQAEAQRIAAGLAQPIGAPRLSEAARGAGSVLILCDDITRQTPADRILPLILQELQEAGIPESAVSLLIAGGTHRAMTQAELERKLGRDILARLRVTQHAEDPALVDLGRTELGTPLQLNRAVVEAEFVLGLGQIVPHRVAGFSGGAKIVQPGICGPATTGATHWLSARYDATEILGRVENPVRSELEQVAERAGLSYLVNVVLDGEASVTQLFAGEFRAAFRAGAEASRALYSARIPRRSPIVIVESFPADLELWQAAKGIYAGDMVVADGGTLILVSPCPEGVSVAHGVEILRHGYAPYDTVAKAVAAHTISDLTVAAHLVHCGGLLARNVEVLLVCPGITPEETEALGYRWAGSVSAAFSGACARAGGCGETVILRHGGDLLPVVG
ncbi:MAG: nickel-dependent lactate racemase [Spirochaetaceae bacterium]|nr:MAG: nickel-dependent lactate racemase [Spirochaetaceae bacterium]